ncbi:MAG: FoF1 ATP synthase subunit a [Eubacteriales bacterium]|nr:FoF1 ATP synthase subunit a [Eubacteriales bacterium]
MQFIMPSAGKWIAIALSLLLGVGALVLRARISQLEHTDEGYRAAKKKRNLLMMAGVLLLWLCSGLILSSFGLGEREFTVSISPARMDLFGLSVSSTVFVSWIVIAALTLITAIIRIFVIPRFQETPRGIQLVLETAVGAINDLAKEKYGQKNEGLASYFFALAALFIGSAIVELFGVRPPTTDLSMTFTYALVTFVLINVYGIRKKGVTGRLQSFVKPNAIIAPFKLLSDLAIPISLACRLFGNMLGGMVVIELVYYALGAYSVGMPAVLGLYFNAFHPLIQFFIFINLSLTFIGEAVEEQMA